MTILINLALLIATIAFLLLQSTILLRFIYYGGNGISKITIIRYLLTATYLVNECVQLFYVTSPIINIVLLALLLSTSVLTYRQMLSDTHIGHHHGYGRRPITLADSQEVRKRSATGVREILFSKIEEDDKE